MSLVAGSVTVDSMGVAHPVPAEGPNLAYALYLGRKGALTPGLPDPNNPKGCVTTAPAEVGSTTFSVSCLGGNAAAAYFPGDLLGTWAYVTRAIESGPYTAGQVTYNIVSATESTVTVDHAVPENFGGSPSPPPVAGPMPSGQVFGYAGPGTSLEAWYNLALPVLVKQLQSLAAIATADAKALVDSLEGEGGGITPSIVFSPGNTSEPLPGNFFTDWPSIIAVVGTLGGFATVRVDSSYQSPAVISGAVGQMSGFQGVTLEPFNMSYVTNNSEIQGVQTGQTKDILQINNGAYFTQLRGVDGPLTIQAQATSISPIQYNVANVGTNRTLSLSNGANITLLVGATQPFISYIGGTSGVAQYSLVLDQNVTLANRTSGVTNPGLIQAALSAQLSVFASNSTYLFFGSVAPIFSGAGEVDWYVDDTVLPLPNGIGQAANVTTFKNTYITQSAPSTIVWMPALPVGIPLSYGIVPTWAQVYACISAVNSRITDVYVDSGATVPAGTWDIAGVILHGTPANASLAIAYGATLVNCAGITDALIISMSPSIPLPFAFQPGVGTSFTVSKNAALVINEEFATQPFMVIPDGMTFTLTVTDGGYLANNGETSSGMVGLGGAGTVIHATGRDASSTNPFTSIVFVGSAGTLNLSRDGSCPQMTSTQLTYFTGTLNDFPLDAAVNILPTIQPAPASPYPGQYYFDQTSNTWYVWNSTIPAWVSVILGVGTYFGQPIIDVSKPPYNADNTGVVDATTPITDAITFAVNALYLTIPIFYIVYLPGTYLVTSIVGPSGIDGAILTLWGDILAGTFITNDGTVTILDLSASTGYFVYIRDINFETSSDAPMSGVPGVNLYGAGIDYPSILERVFISTFDPAVLISGYPQISVIDFEARNSNTGILIKNSSAYITAPYITTTYTAGIQVGSDGEPSTAVILGGTIVGNTLGILVSVGSAQISGGACSGNTTDIMFDSGSNNSNWTNSGAQIVVDNGVGTIPAIIGSPITAAATISPYNNVTGIYHITGTTPISTITAPTYGGGATPPPAIVTLIFDSGGTLLFTGNLSRASTPGVGEVVVFYYDNSESVWFY